jgi:hypothetical protein
MTGHPATCARPHTNGSTNGAGAGLLIHGWNAFFARPIAESEVDREVELIDDDPPAADWRPQKLQRHAKRATARR